MIELLNIDCMEYMARLADKAFDLAIVDPEYGIGKSWSKDRFSPFYKHRSTYTNKTPPTEKYFKELFRISKEQIIWGCNYYWNYLTPSNNLIFWDKKRDPLISFNSAGELAWASIKKYPLMKAEFAWNGFVTCEPRYGRHPHEKPVSLYKWLLKNYAKPGDKILDTHGGSMSIAIACHEMGFDLTLCEIDKDYYEAGLKRVAEAMKQQVLFNYESI